VKFNLGCWWDHRADYINLDFMTEHRPNRVATYESAGIDRGMDKIFSQDALEDLPRTSPGDILAE
jgi:hypothetical protein